MANRESFGFNLNGMYEFQLGKYKAGDFYTEHMDCNLLNNASQRKLSVTVQLSHSKEYKGGEFEVMYIMRGKTIKKKIKGQKGSVFIFPSWMEHRVKPVTKGTRYSVVQWFAGPPWK